jgi:Uma2 family endonuclease
MSVDEYLASSSKRDGFLFDRAMGSESHARLQLKLAQYLANREQAWGIRVYANLRVKLGASRFAVPDLCVYRLPDVSANFPDNPPYLWIEILSEDLMMELWRKIDAVISGGAPYFWVIAPETLESQLATVSGRSSVPDQTLRLPNSPIVVPLREVLEI